MAEVTDVDIVSGAPTGGTGTVPTLSKTNTVIGAVTETAPASDTASSGLNGRLQRIAQRITSLIALLPTALGASGGLKVDGSGTALPVSGTVTANAGTGNHAITAASGSIASGSIASGAMAAGSHAAGAGVDGWDLTQGAIADAAVTAGATGSLSAKLRSISRDIGSLVTAIGSTAWDLGLGTGGSRTQRVTVDTAQLASALSAYAAIATSPAQQVAHPTDHPTMSVAQDTARLLNGASGTSLTPKWATIAVSSSGENQIVAAVTSKKIRVVFWDLIPNAAVNAKWRSATTDSPGVWTDKTGLYYMASQGNGQRAGFNPVGWFETASGEALSLNLSGAVAVGGVVGYVEV